MTTHAPAPPAAASRSGSRVYGAFAGVASGAFGLSVADLVSGFVDPTSSPVLAVGGTFIDLTPAWLKELAITTFGTNDKLALLTGMSVVLTLLAAAAGQLAARSARWGSGLVLILGLIGAVAALSRPTATWFAWVPSMVGALFAAVVLARLAAPRATAPDDGPADADDQPGVPARRALLALAATGGAAAAVAVTGRVVGELRSPGRQLDVRLPRPADPAPAVPPAASLAVAGLTPLVTATGDFYRIDTALSVPRVDSRTWRLRVHGLVDQVVELSYADLLGLPLVERMITLTCVSNEVGGVLAGNATWLGYPIAQLLARARPQAGADLLLSTSVDGFTAGTPLAALRGDRDALLAVAMNGRPLPAEHGFPVRMIVPGIYGYASATKWVTDLEVTRFDRAKSYWTQRGWAAQAPIRTASRIDVPKPFAQVPAGPVVVAGVAWAQHRGVQGVELRVDGGAWQRADLAESAGQEVWRQWKFAWDAAAGSHRLEVRATDATGTTQPGDRRPPMPDGATGWHSVVVTVT